MSRRTTKRGPLVYLLLGAVIAIWGYIGTRVTGFFTRPQPEPPGVAQVIMPDRPASMHARRPSFEVDFPDPFALPTAWYQPKAPVPDEPSPAEPHPERPVPQLILNGIIGHTAILQSQDAQIHLVQAGDVILDVHIDRVHDDAVEGTFDGRPVMLSIGHPFDS